MHLTVASTSLLAATVAAATNVTATCAPGLKMFLGRGTTENGTGVLGGLAEKIVNQIPGSDFQSVDYPASWDNPMYFQSVGEGTVALRKALTDYVTACPGSKVALLGYSQGSQITMNNLCGTTEVWGLLERVEPASRELIKDVAAVVLFGDPSSSKDDSYRRGSAENDGIFLRTSYEACEAIGDRIASFCDTGDIFCDAGSKGQLGVHESYLDVYSEDAIDFILEKFGSVANSTSSPTTSGLPESTNSGGPENSASSVGRSFISLALAWLGTVVVVQ